jgi:hypothetical protein
MRMSKYADDYEEAVYQLARRILDVAERSPVAPGEVADFDSLVNAFGPDGRTTREERRHRVVGVPRRRPELRSQPVPVPLAWNLQARNALFTGRDQVLESLHERLLANGGAAARPVVLHGLGGVGKTQVAVEYAYRYMADYDVVWWVPAEQRDLINPALAKLAGYLGLRVGENITDTAQEVREALRQGSPCPRWLLIFDNADDPDELAPFFPAGPGHVLITSGSLVWSRAAEPMEIDVFARAESLEYLQRRVSSLSSRDAHMAALCRTPWRSLTER